MPTRYFILSDHHAPVEVFDPAAWRQWMADNDTVLRRTEFEGPGISVVTRFLGTTNADGPKSLYATSIAEGRHHGTTIPSPTYDDAIQEHDRIVDRLLGEVRASTRGGP